MLAQRVCLFHPHFLPGLFLYAQGLLAEKGGDLMRWEARKNRPFRLFPVTNRLIC